MSGVIDYSKMSISEIIDDLLTLIRDAPIYSIRRKQLEQIKESVSFLELPEDRGLHLCNIGKVLNGLYESYGPTKKLGSNRSHETFWEPIKERMEKAFEGIK